MIFIILSFIFYILSKQYSMDLNFDKNSIKTKECIHFKFTQKKRFRKLCPKFCISYL